MPAKLENELVEIYSKEVEALAMTTSKYTSILGAAEIDAIVHAFRLAIEHSGEKITAQMLFDMIHDNTELKLDSNGD